MIGYKIQIEEFTTQRLVTLTMTSDRVI